MADLSAMTAVAYLRTLAIPGREETETASEARDERIRGTLVVFLERDLEGAGRLEALRGLYSLLLGDGAGSRAAVAEVLDSVSWEILGLVLGCLEQSVTFTPGRKDGVTGSLFPHGSGNNSNGNKNEGCYQATMERVPNAEEEVAVLSERLALEMAEMFSPKELHIMALEHLHAYSGNRTLRVVLTILRRSTQRMPPVQRAKFLEAAMQPALEATKRAAAWGASAPEANGTRSADCQRDSSSDSDEQDSLLGLCGDAHGGQSQLQLPPTDQEVPPRAAYEAAASAAMAAIDFAAPLLVQARAERVSAFSAAATTVVEGHYAREEAPERTGSGATARKATAMAAADVSLAAYIGFALSALELAAETSPCATAATAGPTLGLEHSASAETLARAEETLVGLVIGGPAVDLQFVLFHGCRLSYAGRIKRRNGGQEGEREQWKGASSNCGGLARLGELAVTGAMPWGLRGVSTLAYLVACEPKLRNKWLPLVWSPQAERRMFLPHAETLMRDRSKRLASKGLELACFVAERLGRSFPDKTGALAFEWDSEDEVLEEAWGGGTDAAAVDDKKDIISRSASEGKRRQQVAFDPYRFDLAGFLQVLVDVMVSCPLPALRARGHAATSAFLAAAGEASRFRVLKRLIERCPWPNATGLLLDAFRREIDRALRCPTDEPSFAVVGQGGHGSSSNSSSGGGGGGLSSSNRLLSSSLKDGVDSCTTKGRTPGSSSSSDVAGDVAGSPAPGSVSSPRTRRGGAASPFASAPAGDVVCQQLRRACWRGTPASLLMDMDSRTGGLTLARYAYALDGAGCGGGGRGEGRLKLHNPEKLRDNRRLVQGLLDELRGAAIGAESAGSEYFRLFILEDAAQQCLKQLQS